MPHPTIHPRSLLLGLAACLALSLGACTSTPRDADHATRSGTLLAIGGALEDDNAAVYQRFIALAGPGGRIVIATAASLDEPGADTSRRAVLSRYAPAAPLDTITRTTPDPDAARIIDHASAIFFTGGDQKRIADLYRPGGHDTQAAAAMRRLLSRGGVIAGTSAGEAMMSDPMFLTGRSTEALGFTPAKPPSPDDTPSHPGPQIGTGMGLEPWVIVDSHFFERDRFGRLVAALETSHRPLGLGVGENACVEINLASAHASCVGDVPSLLVDVRHLSRDGLARRGVATRLLARGDRVALDRVQAPGSGPAVRHPGDDASWSNLTDGGSRAFFRSAAEFPCLRHLDGYRLSARPSSGGWSIVDLTPEPPKGH